MYPLVFPSSKEGPGDQDGDGAPAHKVARVSGVEASVVPVGDGDGMDVDPDICTCGVHGQSNWQRVSMLNDAGRLAALAAAVDAAIDAERVRHTGCGGWGGEAIW